MAELAAEEENAGIRVMVGPWESSQLIYTPRARVFDHFDHEIHSIRGGFEGADEGTRKARIMLLEGTDLALDISTPGR